MATTSTTSPDLLMNKLPGTSGISGATGTTGTTGTGTVDTSQPAPNTVAVGSQNAPQTNTQNLTKVPTQGIGPDGKPIYDVFAGQEHIADPNDPRLKGVNIATLPTGTAPSKFQSAFNTQKAAGITSPTTTGAGLDLVNNSVPSDTTNTQANVVLNANLAHQKYLSDYAAFQSSANQQQTLVQQYQQMSQQLGIPDLNTQLLNMKTIMDGSEQDIRDEVTKAGGFATNSQVLALTDSRNKTMIQNYNNLLQTRADMQNNLTTMMGLSEQDRQYAAAQIDKQLNFDQAQETYANQMLKNAQDSLKNSATTMGWSGVLESALASGDPQAVARINSTMGSGFDLRAAAQKEAEAKLAAQQTSQLDVQLKQAQIAAQNASTAKSKAETSKAYFDMKNSGSGGSALTQEVFKQNTLQSAADQQTLNSNYTQILAILHKVGITDPSQITEKEVSKMTTADQITIGKALGRMQTPDIARMGGETANPLDPVGFAEKGKEFFRQTFTGRLYDPSRVVDAVKSANALYAERNGLEQTPPPDSNLQLLTPDEIPSGYYQASDGLLYRK